MEAFIYMNLFVTGQIHFCLSKIPLFFLWKLYTFIVKSEIFQKGIKKKHSYLKIIIV